MSDSKISGLPAADALTDADLIPVVQDGATKKATAAQLKTHAARGAPQWIKKTVSYADFVPYGEEGAARAPIFTLAPGQTLITCGLIVNTTFDDTGGGVLKTWYEAAQLQYSPIPFTATPLNSGMLWLSSMIDAATLDGVAAEPVDLYVQATAWNGDGTQGQATAYLLVATAGETTDVTTVENPTSARLLDVGRVNFTDLLTNGPQAITLPPNAWIYGAFGNDQLAIDGATDSAIYLWDGLQPADKSVYIGSKGDGPDFRTDLAKTIQPVQELKLYASIGNIYFQSSGVGSYPGATQPVSASDIGENYASISGSLILASNGWVYYCSTGGQTDTVEPTWTDHEDTSEFFDGTVGWTGIGLAPTTGYVRPYIVVWQPVSANNAKFLPTVTDGTTAVAAPGTLRFDGATVTNDGGTAVVTSLRVITKNGPPTGPAHNEDIAISGTPTTGTFTITFRGQTTAPIAYDATNTDIALAMELLSSVGAGNIRAYPTYETYTLAADNNVYLQFIGDLGAQPVEAFTITDSTDGSLTAVSDEAGSTNDPPDAQLAPGGVQFIFDQTDGAAKFHIKAKTADGTVVYSSPIALS